MLIDFVRDEGVQEVLDDLESELVEAWKEATTTDRRERLWHQSWALREIRARLEVEAEDEQRRKQA